MIVIRHAKRTLRVTLCKCSRILAECDSAGEDPIGPKKTKQFDQFRPTIIASASTRGDQRSVASFIRNDPLLVAQQAQSSESP
jgi:hypothetical protein